MNRYDHLIKINSDDCIGCTRCMRVCPTEAIRIVDGKVRLSTEKCVSCGECFSICHCHAFMIEADQLNKLRRYRYNVAILPIAIYGMIKNPEDLNVIYVTLLDMGFDKVVDLSMFYQLLTEEIEHYVNHNQRYPYVLTQCPSIVKLVQLKFPSLSSKFLPFDFPYEMCAKVLRKHIGDQLNLTDDEIGISYITECLANLTAIKEAIGKQQSNVDSVFLLSTILKNILQHINADVSNVSKISAEGILWSKVGAIRRTTTLTEYLSVDGINYVSNILEKAELGQLNHIKILECYSCVGGCVGGTFTLENPFIAKTKVNGLYEILKGENNLTAYSELKKLLNNESWSFEKDLESINVNQLDIDFLTSLVKLQTINELYQKLPKIDCSACGSPSCRALAEDVAHGIKRMEDCVVINRKDWCDDDNVEYQRRS